MAAATFERIFREELQQLRPDLGPEEETLKGINSKIDHSNVPLAALCLSGGGIRSAAFALGILQGLARFGLLGRFDYLSTVSGGGYIGSWLTAWRYHRALADNAQTDAEKAASDQKVYESIDRTRSESGGEKPERS
jgi:predicted acylesterase/phospholipase RssA